MDLTEAAESLRAAVIDRNAAEGEWRAAQRGAERTSAVYQMARAKVTRWQELIVAIAGGGGLYCSHCFLFREPAAFSGSCYACDDCMQATTLPTHDPMPRHGEDTHV